MAGINAGPSQGFNSNRMIQRPTGPTQRPMGMAGQLGMARPMQGRVNPAIGRDQSLPVGQPMMGPTQPNPMPIQQPIQPIPGDTTLPVGQPQMGPTEPMPQMPIDTGPSYMGLNNANIPNTMGSSMNSSGLLNAYAGTGAGMSNRPFRNKLFY